MGAPGTGPRRGPSGALVACPRQQSELMNSYLRNLRLAVFLTGAPLTAFADAAVEDVGFPIPPITTSVAVHDVHIAIVASGTVKRIGTEKGQDLFQVDVNANLQDLQRNLAPLLKAEIDRDDNCGDRIALQDATFVPAAPAGLLTARLHYERYACAKALGKQIVKRLIGGNATVDVTLTPQVEEHEIVKLAADVRVKDADGSLAEVLGSGDFGDKLREKTTAAVQKAISKVTDKNAALPPALRDMARLDEARFMDAGGGVLILQLHGTVRLSADQLKAATGAASGFSGKGSQ